MMKFISALCFLAIIINEDIAGQSHNLKTWEVYEIQLKASASSQNPYVDCLKEGHKAYVLARFSGISGNAFSRSFLVPGFWDGSDIWKVRFAPPFSGTWKFETESTDKGLNKKKGTLEVTDWAENEKNINPTRRGFITVNKTGPRTGRFFIYADGTPCLWIGDTWWDWTDRRITFESFKDLVDTRSEQGFNIGQLFFAANGWGGKSSLLDRSFMHPDIAQIQKVEKMIAYANSKGITIWIHPWWCRANINTIIGDENMRRWWRYVIDRLHAYNVIWVLAGEYNMNNYGGFSLEFWKDLGKLVKSEDPYDRIVGVHPTPPIWEGGSEAPQWSTATVINDQSWLDYNQSQSGHSKWCNELVPEIIKEAYDKEPAKPIVITEPWYEFIEGNPTAMDIRFGAWAAVMCGAAGHSYGGGHAWCAHLPERPTKVGSWPLDTSFKANTLMYPGAVSIGFMARFLRGLQWWTLSPHPELVLENSSPYCMADPGREYLIYLRYGGNVKLDLSMIPDENNFGFQWIDLKSNRVLNEGLIKGGKITELKCPDDFPRILNFKDWVLHIYKK